MKAPAFIERGAARPDERAGRRRIAGVKAPAFIERAMSGARRERAPRIAGVKAPAFIERSTVRGVSRVRLGLRG